MAGVNSVVPSPDFGDGNSDQIHYRKRSQERGRFDQVAQANVVGAEAARIVAQELRLDDR